jgi:hypothetical protein
MNRKDLIEALSLPAVIPVLNGQQGVHFWFGFRGVFSYVLEAGGPFWRGLLDGSLSAGGE